MELYLVTMSCGAEFHVRAKTSVDAIKKAWKLHPRECPNGCGDREPTVVRFLRHLGRVY